MGISHHPYAALPTNNTAEECVRTHALVAVYLRGRKKRGEIATKTAKTQWSTLYQFAEVAPDPARITRRSIRTWQERYDYLAQSTKRNRLTVVRKFVAWLREEGHLRGDPMKDVAPLKEPKRLPRALPP